MAKSYHITLEVHDEGEWPRIAPENLMQHVDVRLPNGLTVAHAAVSETNRVAHYDALVAAASYIPEQVDLNLPRFKDADDSETVAIEVTIGWLREVRDALAGVDGGKDTR